MVSFYTLCFLLVTTMALPAKQLYYSFVIEKAFHAFNLHTMTTMTTTDNRIMISTAGEIADQFTALLDQYGTFTMGGHQLSFTPEGTLTTRHIAHSAPDLRHLATFSIKDGHLRHNGLEEFSACQAEQGKYTLHASQSPSSSCPRRIDGIRIAVVDSLGLPAKDQDSPEFVYRTGHPLFLS